MAEASPSKPGALPRGPSPVPVAFLNVAHSYVPGTKVECHYTLPPGTKPSARDWIGIFKVWGAGGVGDLHALVSPCVEHYHLSPKSPNHPPASETGAQTWGFLMGATAPGKERRFPVPHPTSKDPGDNISGSCKAGDMGGHLVAGQLGFLPALKIGWGLASKKPGSCSVLQEGIGIQLLEWGGKAGLLGSFTSSAPWLLCASVSPPWPKWAAEPQPCPGLCVCPCRWKRRP